jgi:hypothetical protein
MHNHVLQKKETPEMASKNIIRMAMSGSLFGVPLPCGEYVAVVLTLKRITYGTGHD